MNDRDLDIAACKDMDPEIWFENIPVYVKKAKEVCGTCPVVEKCLDYAIKENIHDGVWGGLTDAERRTLLRKYSTKRSYMEARAG